MKMNEIQDEFSKDMKFDLSNLDKMSIRIPYLHSKWYSIMVEEIKILKGIDSTMKTMKRDKFLYYTGRGRDDEYVKNPFDHKILKSEIDMFMEADEEYRVLHNHYSIQKIKVDMIEANIKQINQLSFNIRNAIEALKFKSGAN
jgi:hypothetical protein